MKKSEKRVEKIDDSRESRKKSWRKPTLRQADINRQTQTFFFSPDSPQP
ncbi:MAG: hypothetical protein P8020_18700 [Acidobacteriota bacterium]